MADWFKFYENDLDEIRLQYAVAQLPEVIPVWVGILSEACRHKSGTVSWGNDEIELFGFSKRLGVSIPKVNEAINVLQKIRYIERGTNTLTIIKWDEKQSEYCQKKTSKQNQRGDKNPMRVGTVSGHSRDIVGQEERRGEEKRIHTQVGDVSAKLLSFYGRPDNSKLSYMEESLIADLLRRPDIESELKFLETHKRDQYFPRSLESLLNKWQQTIDRYKTNANHTNSNPQRVDRSIGTANEGLAEQYRGILKRSKVQSVQ